MGSRLKRGLLVVVLALACTGATGALAPGAGLAAACTAPQGQTGATSWTGMGDGTNWEDDRNWSNGGPSGECDASIPAGNAVTMDVGGSAASITLDGTLSVVGSTSTTGSSQDSSISSSFTIGSTGTLHLTSTGSNPGAPIVGGTIVNSGLVSIDAGATGANTRRDLRANVTNNAAGTIDVHTDLGTCGCGGAHTWINNGTITVDSGVTATFSGTGQGASLTQSGGTFANNGTSVFFGDVTHSGGTTSGNPIQLCGTLSASGPGTASFELPTPDMGCNGATIGSDIGSGDSVLLQAGPATVDVSATSFTNHGTLTLDSTPDHLVQLHGTLLTNAGTFNLTGSNMEMGLTNNGTATIAAGSTTNIDGVVTQAAGSLDVSGDLNTTKGATLSGGTITNSGVLGAIGFSHTGGNTTGNPILVCDDLAAQGPGTASFTLVRAVPDNPNGACSNGGLTTDIGSDDTVTVQAGGGQFDVFPASDFANFGTLNFDTGPNLIQLHGSTVTNDGTLSLGTGAGAVTVIASSFTNNGTMGINAGSSTSVSSAVNQAGGTLDIAGELDAGGAVTGGLVSVEGNWNLSGSLPLTGGTLLGTGTITGDLVNGATVSPGSVTAAGRLSITGNYTQQTGGQLMSRITSGGNDLLSVGGSATLAGTLAVSGDGFRPAAGQTFVVLSDASQSGQFATVTGQGYHAVYDPTDVKLVPTQVSVSPTALGFGTGSGGPQPVGSTSPAQSVTVMNNGQEPVSFSTVSIAGAQAASFALTSDSCSNHTIGPGQSCAASVTFAPTASGRAGAELSIADNAVGSPQGVALSGVGGTRAASLSVGSVRFDSVPGETTKAQTVTVSSSGTVALKIASVTISGADAKLFHLDADYCSQTTVAPGSSCSFALSFSPSATGTFSASVAVADDAHAGSPQRVGLTGVSVRGGVVTGHVFNGGLPGRPPLAGAVIAACPDAGVSRSCREAVSDRAGRYSLRTPVGGVTLSVYPPRGKVSSASADVIVSGAGPTVHDFVLSVPRPPNGGVSFNTADGTQSTGPPVINQGQPFAINVPVKISRTGPPGKALLYSYIVGVGGNAASDSGKNFYTVEVALFAVHYGARGVADALTRPVEGLVNCGRPVAGSPCVALAAESGVDTASGSGVAAISRASSRSSGARATAAARAATADCPQAYGWTITTNDAGGINIEYKFADGTIRVLPLPQIGIPPLPASGNLGQDFLTAALIGGANTAFNIINPWAGAYNTFIGLANTVVTSVNSNSTDLKNLELGNGVLSLAVKLAGNLHGPWSWFAQAASGFYGTAANQATHGSSALQYDAKPQCPAKHGDGYFDPSGSVRTTAGAPVAGAKVTLATASAPRARSTRVPNGSVVMSPANRRNPDRTTSLGTFGWDTLPGFFEVSASKRGCTAVRGHGLSVRTPLFAVPPPRMSLVLRLRCPKLRRAATRTTLRVLHGGSGSVVLLATVRPRTGRKTAARIHQLIGAVTFKAGGRTLGVVPVKTTTATAAGTIPAARHRVRRYTATFSGNAGYSSSGASGR